MGSHNKRRRRGGDSIPNASTSSGPGASGGIGASSAAPSPPHEAVGGKKRKVKKWSPLELDTIDAQEEAAGGSISPSSSAATSQLNAAVAPFEPRSVVKAEGKPQIEDLDPTRFLEAPLCTQSRQLSEIGSDSEITPTQASFNVGCASKRTPSPVSSTPIQAPITTSAQNSFSASSQTSVPHTVEASVSTPTKATLPESLLASDSTPTNGSIPNPIQAPNHTPNCLPVLTQSQSSSRSASDSISTWLLNRSRFNTPTKSSSNATQTSKVTSPLALPCDSQETTKKLDGVMSKFQDLDGFGIEEWNRTEEQAHYSDSPEQLTVPPQPVTSYTTVGSLKPAAHQQFTAPNRIQRDGTIRRPPQASAQARGHDNHFGGRGTNQQYNTGYGTSIQPQYVSMNQPQHGFLSQPQFNGPVQSQYGSMSQPQYGSSNQSQHGPATQSQYGSIRPRYSEPSNQSQSGSVNQLQYGSSSQSQYGPIENPQNSGSSTSMTLSDDEKYVLQTMGLSEPLIGHSGPPMCHENGPPAHLDMVAMNDLSLNPHAESFNLQGQVKDDEAGQSIFTHKPQPKIEKMQTLLSLSQYKNPLQQVAKDHLAEFAAPVAQQQAPVEATSYKPFTGTHAQENAGYETHHEEDFDRNYRFPPPGLAHPSQLGTVYDHQTASGFSSYNEQVTANHQHQMRFGRPQPLTAGPPGQRQNGGFTTHGMPLGQGIQAGNSHLSNVQQPPFLPPNSPWLPHNRNNMFTSVPTEHSKIRNTLPLDECRKYYPNGFPSDMTGEYTRLPAAEHNKNVGVIARPVMTEEDIQRKKQNEWFHSGVRKFNKTANEHLAELETRNYELEHGLQPLPSPDPTSDDDETLTIKDLQKMSEPDVAVPLLHGVFGSLLRYADQVPAPNNQSVMSRFAPAPAWCIDNSEKGNQSFFGEDWGPPPKRLGRDPRYQPFE